MLEKVSLKESLPEFRIYTFRNGEPISRFHWECWVTGEATIMLRVSHTDCPLPSPLLETRSPFVLSEAARQTLNMPLQRGKFHFTHAVRLNFLLAISCTMDYMT